MWHGEHIQHGRTIATPADGQKWNAERLAKAWATPWDVRSPARPEISVPELRADDAARVPDAVHVLRHVYIKMSDLERHGYMAGCQKCESLVRGPTSSSNHSDRCRKRLMEGIAKMDEGRECIAEI